jgi:hypothetical protein
VASLPDTSSGLSDFAAAGSKPTALAKGGNPPDAVLQNNTDIAVGTRAIFDCAQSKIARVPTFAVFIS